MMLIYYTSAPLPFPSLPSPLLPSPSLSPYFEENLFSQSVLPLDTLDNFRDQVLVSIFSKKYLI